MAQPSLNVYTEINVAKVATDVARFTTISSALAAITDNAVGKRYAVRVAPGTYTEKVTCKNYIDLVADGGRAETIISFTATAHDEPTVTAAICTIKGFTITSDGNTGTLRARSLNAGTPGFRIEDCVLTVTNSAAAATCFNATASCTLQDCEVDTAAGAATAALFATAAQAYVVNDTSLGGATNSASMTTTISVTLTQCTCSNLISQVNGTLYIRRCRVQGVSLSTAICAVDVEHSQFTAAITTVAEAIAHSITLRECNLNGQGITSNATGGTAIDLYGCSNVGALIQAGTGAVTISKSSLGAVSNNGTATMTLVDSALAALAQAAAAGTINVTNCSMTTISTGAAGTVRLNGGCLFTDISVNAGVLTWKVDPNHIKVVAGTANMKVANALTLAAAGDVIQIMPGTYAESNLTLIASVNLVGTDHNQCIIEAADAANAILNAGVACTISNLTISNTNAGHPAIEVTAGTLTVLNCIARGFAAGNAIAMLAGTLALEGCTISIGNVSLSTAPCTLTATATKFSDNIDTAADASAHSMTFLGCDFTSNSILSLATVATTLTLANCSRVGTVTNAGSGTFTIRDSDILAINATATGTFVISGGFVNAITRAAASVVWWQDENTLKVIPSATTTDTVLQYAITASSAGDVILIYPGTYTESITCKSGVNIRGVGARGSAVITRVDADIITLNSCELENLTVRLQTPTVAHYLVLDNGVAYTAKLINLALEITTPGNLAHQLFRFAAAGTYTLERCYASIDFGVNNPVAVSILNTGVAATIRLFNNDFSMTSTGAFHIFASVAGTWSGGQNRWAGGCGMFNVALATVTLDDESVVCSATSAVVSGNVLLRKGRTIYEVYPGMQIQHALTAGAGLEVIVRAGAHAPTANLTVSANTLVRGEGFATIITPTGAAIANGIVLGGNNITLRDMKVVLAAGAGAPTTRPNVVYATGRTQLWLENLWLVGDITVGDDASDLRQCGTCFDEVSTSKVVNCRAENNLRHGIHLNATAAADYNNFIGNTSTLNTVNGLKITGASANKNIVLGNQLLGNTGANLNDGGTLTEVGHNVTV